MPTFYFWRNMINSVNVPEQTVNAQSLVLFTNDRVRTNRGNACCGGWLTHDSGSGQFTLTSNGHCSIFEIQFNANLTSTATGLVSLAIQSNGESISGTEMDYTVVTAGDYISISASTLIRVPCGGSVIVAVENISANSATVKDANIIIKKVA